MFLLLHLVSEAWTGKNVYIRNAFDNLVEPIDLFRTYTLTLLTTIFQGHASLLILQKIRSGKSSIVISKSKSEANCRIEKGWRVLNVNSVACRLLAVATQN